MVIINCDDFGLTPGINLACIETHKFGTISTASIMANAPAFNDAVRLAKLNPNLGIGVHLNLVQGTPLTAPNYKLIDERDGCFSRSKLLHEIETGIFSTTRKMILEELLAQIELVKAAGIKPTHLDSHTHIHRQAGVIDIVEHLSETYMLPVRKCPSNIVMQTSYCRPLSGKQLQEVIDTVRWAFSKSSSVELYAHPTVIDEDPQYKKLLTGGVEWKNNRINDRSNLLSYDVRKIIESSCSGLSTWSDL